VPPSLSIHEAGGPLRSVLSPGRTESIAPFRFSVPELSTVAAADGFPMPARILKPRDFASSRRYPVILYVYGGPSSPTGSDSWDYSFAGNTYFDQILANRGYVVVSIDNRSATGVSKTLENTVARRVWSDGELADIPLATGAGALVPIIEEVRPDTVVTFGPEGMTGHGAEAVIADFPIHLVSPAQIPAERQLLEWKYATVRQQLVQPGGEKDIGIEIESSEAEDSQVAKEIAFLDRKG